MTVYHTTDHDMTLVSSPSELMPTDAQLRAIALSESTPLDESELDADSYADSIMTELGL